MGGTLVWQLPLPIHFSMSLYRALVGLVYMNHRTI